MKGFFRRVLLKTLPTALLLGVFAVFLVSEVDANKTYASNYPLLKTAWDVSGAKLSGININAWCLLPGEFSDVSSLIRQVEETGEKLGIKVVPERVEIADSPTVKMANYKREKDESSLEISAQSMNMELGQNIIDENYLIVDLYEKNWDKVESLNETLSSLFPSEGKNRISVAVLGRYRGNLNAKEKNCIIEKVFAVLKAKQVEMMEEGNFLSVSGYTREFKQKIRADNHLINVNLAFTYDEIRQETQFILATPIITIEY